MCPIKDSKKGQNKSIFNFSYPYPLSQNGSWILQEPSWAISQNNSSLFVALLPRFYSELWIFISLWLSWRLQQSFHVLILNDQTCITMFKVLINPLIFPHQSGTLLLTKHNGHTSKSTYLIGAECHVGESLYNTETPGAAEKQVWHKVGCRQNVLLKSRESGM